METEPWTIFFLSVYHFLYVENNSTKNKEKALVAQVGREATTLDEALRAHQKKPEKSVSDCVYVWALYLN